MTIGARELLELRSDPAQAGRRAAAIRSAAFGTGARVLEAPAHGAPERASILRGDVQLALDAWPVATEWRPGDRVLVRVELADASPWAEWLATLAASTLPRASLAPFSRALGGTQRLWAIAAARIALPTHVHVEARYDLLGIRLAQVALGFGADVLAGPIEPERALPLAGLPRPDERTRSGLRALIEQVGLTAVEEAAG
jgi:hypothetical protein